MKLSIFLNYCAALIILAIISLFSFWIYTDIKNKKPVDNSKISLSFSEEKLHSKDSTIIYINNKFISDFNNLKDSLNTKIEKLKDLKKDINESESRNSDLFKLLLALIGAVFAIIGFFGFKSINDVRESALKNAVNEAINAAEKKAKEVADFEAKKIAGEKAHSVATEVAQEVAVKKAEQETTKYLEAKFPEYFRKWEQTYKASSDEQFTDLFDRINKLENPESYGIENKKVKELSEKYQELLSIVEKLRIEKLGRK